MASKRRADSADEPGSKLSKKDAFNARVVAAGDKLNLVAADPQGQTQCPAKDTLFGGDYTKNAPELGTLFIQDNSAPTTECYEATENVRDFTEAPFSRQTINDRDRTILNNIPAFVNISFENWRGNIRVETLMKKLIGADVSNALKAHFGTKEAMRDYNRIRIEFPGLIEPVVLTKSDSEEWFMNTFPTGLDDLIEIYNYDIQSPQFDRTEGSTIIMKSDNPIIAQFYPFQDDSDGDDSEFENPEERLPIDYFEIDDGNGEVLTYPFFRAGGIFRDDVFVAQNNIKWEYMEEGDTVKVALLSAPVNRRVSDLRRPTAEEAREFWQAELGENYEDIPEYLTLRDNAAGQTYTVENLQRLLNNHPGRAFDVMDEHLESAVLVSGNLPDRDSPIDYYELDDMNGTSLNEPFLRAGGIFGNNVFSAINIIDWDDMEEGETVNVALMSAPVDRRVSNLRRPTAEEAREFWQAELGENYVERCEYPYTVENLQRLLNNHPGRAFDVMDQHFQSAVLVSGNLPNERSPIRYYDHIDESYPFLLAENIFPDSGDWEWLKDTHQIFAAQNTIDWTQIGPEQELEVQLLQAPVNGHVHLLPRPTDEELRQFWQIALEFDSNLDTYVEERPERQTYMIPFGRLPWFLCDNPGLAFRVVMSGRAATLVATVLP